MARDPQERTIRLTLRSGGLLVFCVAVLASSFGIPTAASYGAQVTGDEPQYLITSMSLARDRDLDVSDEIAGRAYSDFHEVTLDQQTRPGPEGREVSPHDPGLPVLLAVPMALAGWVGAKFFMASLHGVLAILLLLIAHRRLGVPVAPATALVALFAASAPAAVYGQQIYPEIPAAVCVAVGLWAILGGMLGRQTALLAGCVIALPWLSIKYAPVAATLALFGMWTLSRTGRRRAAGYVLGAMAAAGALYVVAHLAWYGGVTPYAAGDHFVSSGEFSVIGTNVNLAGRSSRLMGLLIDRRFGLGAWQPLYLLVVPAAAFAWSRRFHGATVLVTIALVGWLNASFIALTMHGWWWPGRQVVVILPALVVLTIRWASGSRRSLRTAYGLGAFGVVTYLWLAFEGARGGITWVVDFFETSAPTYGLLSAVLPDHMDPSASTWLLHGIWLAGAGMAAVAGWRAGRLGESNPRERSPAGGGSGHPGRNLERV